MKIKHVILSTVLAWSSVSSAMAESLAGTTWVTIDDKTGKPRAEVQLSEVNDVVSGQIISVYPQPGDTGICSKCPGAFKDKPIKGLRFVWGLKQKGNVNWDGGSILDPKTGKVYRAKMMLKGNQLYVRGYIGVSVLGRTQIWNRKQPFIGN
jgi:uncharacterized protein (DUF2147 family)